LLATAIVTPLYGKPGGLLGRKVVPQSTIRGVLRTLNQSS